MAVTTREAQIASDGDVDVGRVVETTFDEETGVGVGRVVETVVDKNTGVAAERERVVAAVPDGRGNVLLMVREQIRAVQVPGAIGRAVGRRTITAAPSFTAAPAAAAPAPTVAAPAPTAAAPAQPVSSTSSTGLLITLLCCFLPCASSKIILAAFLIIVVVPSAVLAPMIATGALQCPTFILIGSLTTSLIGTVLIIGALCLLFQCCKGEDSGGYRCAIYCCNCLTFLAMLGLIGVSTYFIFVKPPNYDSARKDNCRFLEVPIATLISSYVFLALTCLSTTACYWYVCKKARENSPA